MPLQTEYCFAIEHRSEDVTGNVKQIWELSRLHHLTLLSAAWKVTGKDVYAKATDEQLMSWWKQNPFLSGVNWTSGIEVGIRLISFVWIRRLLDGWYGAPALFEENDLAVSQIRWHQEYLSQVPQQRIVGQQPRDRGSCRPTRGRLRVSLVP